MSCKIGIRIKIVNSNSQQESFKSFELERIVKPTRPNGLEMVSEVVKKLLHVCRLGLLSEGKNFLLVSIDLSLNDNRMSPHKHDI